jgi:hypothetical protein
MKFFIATCIKENQENVQKLLRDANIIVYSSMDIVGFKDNSKPNLLEEWFAAGDEQFESSMLFSFTADSNAFKAMELIKQHNTEDQSNFPIRAFIVPVEQSSF